MLSLPRHHPVSNGAEEDNDADQIAETVPAVENFSTMVRLKKFVCFCDPILDHFKPTLTLQEL